MKKFNYQSGGSWRHQRKKSDVVKNIFLLVSKLVEGIFYLMLQLIKVLGAVITGLAYGLAISLVFIFKELSKLVRFIYPYIKIFWLRILFPVFRKSLAYLRFKLAKKLGSTFSKQKTVLTQKSVIRNRVTGETGPGIGHEDVVFKQSKKSMGIFKIFVITFSSFVGKISFSFWSWLQSVYKHRKEIKIVIWTWLQEIKLFGLWLMRPIIQFFPHLFKKIFHNQSQELASALSPVLCFSDFKRLLREPRQILLRRAVASWMIFFVIFSTISVSSFLPIFNWLFTNQQEAYAAPFSGQIKVSKKSTTISTNGDWYTSLAHSGDGVNGDAETGTFNPIHPGGTSEGASGALAVGRLVLGANTSFAAAPFIGFQPKETANLVGVQLVLENTAVNSLSNSDIVVEVLLFPSASCDGGSCSNYVTGNLGAFVYPSDTVVERRTVWQFNQALSGENLTPGNFGRATFDFRLDPPLPVTAGQHYGFRIINAGAGSPAFGLWGQSPQLNGFPTVNGTRRTIGVDDIDNVSASTMNMPLALTGNSVLVVGTAPLQFSGMVAANSPSGLGAATVRRTENEHWQAVYSAENDEWSITGSVSGPQNNKLKTVINGGTGSSWLNDGTPFTILTEDITSITNKFCVASIEGFAVNQFIDIWDSNTASARFTISALNESDVSCPENSASIITSINTSVNSHNFTVDKNATVALATWKQRIIQGAVQSFTQNMPALNKICVSDSSQFSPNTSGTGANIAIWDNDSVILATNRVTSTSSSDGDCASLNSITVATNIAAGTYTIDQGAQIAEISTTLSNLGSPANGAIIRWTSLNQTQNPSNSNLLARTTSVALAYAKNTAPATSGNNYPFLNNRHIFFLAYGDHDTNAPADGDMIIIGNGRTDPDNYDSPNLLNDFNWAKKEEHVVKIDRHWDAALAYSGSYGGAVGNGAGTLTPFSGYSQNAGWISALITPGSQLGVDNSPNKHYRLNIPGKIVIDSDASLAFGKTGSAIPASSFVDVYFDNISPEVHTLLTANSAATNLLSVVSTAGLMPGDTVLIRDEDTEAVTRLVAAIESETTVRLTSVMVTGYTTDKKAYLAKGIGTELPTGASRRAGVYTMTGLVTTSQSNVRTGRVSLFAQGDDNFRTMKSNLAVDVNGDINSGALGNKLTDSGDTWLDVKDNVVGNWQALDSIAVAGGTNLAADNEYSSTRMGAPNYTNTMPVWTGQATAGGKNDLPTPNMEIAEIGTIPLTDIYNADHNNGTTIFSSNYATSSDWVLFSNNANTEVGDAIYFGDRGNNMFYALEFNLAQPLIANANYVWEYWDGGSWKGFAPRDAYQYQPRTEYCMPLSADIVRNSYTLTVSSGGANFGLDQMVAIIDNDSPTIYRRLGTTAPTATTLTFAHPLPSGYTVSQNAKVCRLNGGQWWAISPSSIFSAEGRRLISWTNNNLNGTPAKRSVNGVSAYWVRARLSTFNSWTQSPQNQLTPVGMSGIERVSSGHISVSTGVQEAKITEVLPGSLYNPNEQFMLEYGNSPGWVETHRYAAAALVRSEAPYVWDIKDGGLNINAVNLRDLMIHNSSIPLTATDYTMKALVKMDMLADATSRRVGLTLRQSLDGNGYAALITKTSSANTIGWYTTLAGVPTLIGSATSKSFLHDAWYCLKAEVSGNTLRTVFWQTNDCEVGDPGTWDNTQTNSLYSSGRIGLYTGSATSNQGMKAVFDQVSTSHGFIDNFEPNDSWRVVGSVNGLIGRAWPSVPFVSDYLKFTIKHKGGRDGVTLPEIGDKIYLSSTAISSYKGLDATVGITTNNNNTKYETWDFEWQPGLEKYKVSGSASGDGGYALPGTTYTAPNNQLSLRINSGEPTATKFGDRMLLLQDNLLRNNGSWIGNNGLGSAALIYPTQTVTGSSVITRYNIEGISETPTYRSRGAIDFWFKPNYDGTPTTTINSEGMYLFDFANQGNTNRIFIRHSPDGYLEASVYGGVAQGILLQQSFSATAGEWYHLRLNWDTTTNTKRAYLNGVPFELGQGSNIGTRAANAGLMYLGNRWTHDAPFNGSIDEFAIFDDDIDTSATCDWGEFSIPDSPWLGGQIAGCDSNTGVNIFHASFDSAMNPQEGFIWADYAFGNPAIIFTNGADTGNERIRIITYPRRTRVWIDNTGEKYTPSARIKSGSGFLESAALATLTGWSHNFTYHHKAVRDSVTNPTFSPVLNLKRSIHIWSDEPITYNGATMGAPINAGLGFGAGSLAGLTGLATIDISHLSMENQYANFFIATNPYTSVKPYPSQNISKSVFYNFYDRAYTVNNKTQGTNFVGAYFITTHFAAANIGQGYNAALSQDIGLDGSIFMGNRNTYVTVPPVAANGAAMFISGRNYTVRNSEFYNNGVAGAGTSGALNFGVGVAKVVIDNNIFSINTNGIRLYGNSFVEMSNNVFDGHISSDVTTVGANYGTGIRSAQSYSSVNVTDRNSIFGRGLWNEADINMPPNTTSFNAESLLQFIGQGTQLLSPVLFGTVDYDNFGRVPEHYFTTTIPGTFIRFGLGKDIVNYTTFGNMRTSGPGLADTTVRTADGYAWRLDPLSSEVALEYAAEVVGVAGKPLVVTGYLRLDDYYGAANLPLVTLSGLGMTGASLSWTAQPIANSWQQFVVSGTPTESALAELKFSVKPDFVIADSGTSQVIANPMGNYLPPLIEDMDKSWQPNQWLGYKLRDVNGKIFDIVKNTDKILYVKGTVVPHLLSTTLTAATAGDYIIFKAPSIYLDDISVLSGTVDTGTLDFFSRGQPVAPFLNTGLTAEAIWSAQYGAFANIGGSFGQLLNDRLSIKRGLISDASATTIEFTTDLSETTSNFYQNQVIVMMSGRNNGLARRIASYDGSSKKITVDASLPFAPAFNDEFVILSQYAVAGGGAGGSVNTAEIAEAVWSYVDRKLTSAALSGGGSLATNADVSALQTDITYIKNKVDGLDADMQVINGKVDQILNKWGSSNAASIISELNEVKARIGTTLDSAESNTLFGRTKYLQDKWGSQNAQVLFDKASDAYNKILAVQVELGYNGKSTTAFSDLQTIASYTDQLEGYIEAMALLVGAPSDSALADTLFGRIKKNQEAIQTLNNISASDIWNYATRSLTGGVSLSNPAQVWEVARAYLNVSGSIGELVANNLDATISSRGTSNLTAADVWSVAERSITGITNPGLAAVATAIWENSTRTLTADDITPQRVWDSLLSSITTVNSIGLLLKTNIDTNISSRASQSTLDALAINVGAIISEIGVGNISAIRTKVDLISWADVTGLVTTAGEIKTKTDNINWLDIIAVKTKTDTIMWADIVGIKTKTDTIDWADISNVANKVQQNADKLNVLVQSLIVARSLVDDPSPTTSQFATNLNNDNDNFYNQGILVFTSGFNAGQVRKITGYDGVSKRITVSPPLSMAPANSDGFTILANQSETASLDAAAVWSYATRTLSDAQLDSGSLVTLAGLQQTETTLMQQIEKTQKTVVGRIINQETLVKSGNSLTILFRAESGLSGVNSPRLNAWDPTGNKILSNQEMVELEDTGVYKYDLIFDAAWGRGQFTVQAAETAGGTKDAVNISVVSMDLAQVGASIELLSQDLISVRSVVAGSTDTTTSLFRTELTSAVSGLYNDALITFTSGANAGVARRIENYNGATKAIIIDPPLPELPQPGDAFTILKQVAVPTTKIKNIATDVVAVRSDVGSIKSDVGAIRSDLVNIKLRLNNIDFSISSLHNKIQQEYSTSNQVNQTELLSAMNTISSSIQGVNVNLGKLDTSLISSLLTVSQESLGDIKYVRNKLADFRAVTNIQREVIEKPVAPVVSTWYTSGSVDLNIMISNPSNIEQKVPVKVYLPKEAKMEHVIESSGLEIQYDVQLDTLYAVGEFQLGAGESIKKFIKMRDIWQIAEEDVVLLRSQAENFFKQLEKTQFSAQALVLKNDIETRTDKIVRTQKENVATPQDKIMTYRENKESLAVAYKSLDEIKSLVTQSAASKSFLGSFSGMQTVTIWGIIIAFVTGFGLLIVILFSMWKHQMQLAGGQLALQARVLGGNKLSKVELAQLLTKDINPQVAANVEKKLTAAERKKLRQYLAAKINNSRVKQKMISFPVFVIDKIRQVSPRFKVLLVAAFICLIAVVMYLLVKNLLPDKAIKNRNLALITTTSTPAETELTSRNSLINATGSNSSELTDSSLLLSFDNEGLIFNSEELNQPISEEIENSIESKSLYNDVLNDLVIEEQEFILIKNTPTGWLNVRRDPDINSEIIAKVNGGEKFIVLTSTIAKKGSSGWHQISLTDGRIGWVSAEYAEIIID